MYIRELILNSPLGALIVHSANAMIVVSFSYYIQNPTHILCRLRTYGKMVLIKMYFSNYIYMLYARTDIAFIYTCVLSFR